MVKTIAILSLDNLDIQKDSRVLRQIKYLSREYTVDVIAYGDPDESMDFPVHSLSIVGSLNLGKWKRRLLTLPLLLLGKLFPDPVYDFWYWNRPGHMQAHEILFKLKPDIIHANEWWTLPIAVNVAKKTGAKIVFDMHEYALDEYDQAWWQFFYKPLIKYMYQKYYRAADVFITVNNSIAKKYQQEFGILPTVVMNAPEAEHQVEFRATNPDKIEIIHHGAAKRDRQLEWMVQVIAKCSDCYHLSFMLFGDQKYVGELEELSKKIAPGMVTFLPPVEPSQIHNILTQFDLGLFLLPSKCFNKWATLPNKFFEFIHAGLATITGPSPEMASLQTTYGFGKASNSFDPSSVAEVLNQLSLGDIDTMKKNAIKASRVLNADTEMEKLLILYSNIIGTN